MYSRLFDGVNMRDVTAYFQNGGTLKLGELASSADVVAALEAVPGLMEKTKHVGLGARESDAARAAAGEFILEGLHSLKRIGRSEELGFQGEEIEEEDEWPPRRGGKKDKRRNFN